jgi:hypothetical protein
MSTGTNIVTARPDPGPCPEHPGCVLLHCANMWCDQLVHYKNQPGQPRRFCSTRCRVAHHRGNR